MSVQASTSPETSAETRGFVFAFLSYLLWGFLPLYLKQLGHIPLLEIVAHRAIWSVPIAGAALLWMGRTADVRAALVNPRMLGMAMLTAAIISVNWGIYLYAIAADRTMEAALGYYINPLFSVFLAAVFLGEKLRTAQLVAIGLAIVAVAILAWERSGLPWISLALAGSWGVYALFKRTLPIGPNQGFFLEVLIISVPALMLVLWLGANGQSHFTGGTLGLNAWLLIGAGIGTAAPLMLYANGAKLLKLSTIGMMQYISPSIVFLLAVFWFREPFTGTTLLAFIFIWAALAVFTWSAFFRRNARA